MKLKSLSNAVVARVFTGLTSYRQNVNKVIDNYFKAIVLLYSFATATTAGTCSTTVAMLIQNYISVL